ncbi:hypothetical protein COU60_05385 [Candidatus Pacearchaeota archaeon CG10_big_fil_rev_8_21_14_0_10_34_76]|nr:MAG: hypothetical protein COU60_05385 [Candidatus Pacearchaeota archaeon CG10_big_fil_rev_8_21_14_0_10_34_76]
MSNLETLFEMVTENIPTLTIGFGAGAGLIYSIARYFSGQPEPGIAYHDKENPSKIRAFKKIPRNYTIQKITKIDGFPSSPSDLVSNPFIDIHLDNGIEMMFSGRKLDDLSRCFLDQTETSRPGITRDELLSALDNKLLGKEVLVHYWGTSSMAISHYGRSNRTARA